MNCYLGGSLGRQSSEYRVFRSEKASIIMVLLRKLRRIHAEGDPRLHYCDYSVTGSTRRPPCLRYPSYETRVATGNRTVVLD